MNDKMLQAIAIPYSALISIIFAMMILSFPLGAYVVFNSEIGQEINFEYPINDLNVFLGGISYQIPVQIEIGDAFIILWSIYLILFTICFIGPKKNFMRTLTSLLTHGIDNEKPSAMVNMITWFSILVIASILVEMTQDQLGIAIEPPEFPNQLIQFFDITFAPIVEEIGFRVLLIGLPLFAMFAHKNSLVLFFKSLWHPSRNLTITNNRTAIALIITVGIFFGLAHIISGEPWSIGKFAQASVAGTIIGWIYFRFGLAPAILVHWATNFFVFANVLFISDISQISMENAFSSPFMQTVEIIIIVTGIVSVTMLLLNHLRTKKEESLQL